MSEQPQSDEPTTRKTKRLSEGCVTATAITVVGGIWLIALALIWSNGNFEKSGQFGDGFGGVTALFSGLAFAGIVITLYLQRGDLQLQREMLEAQYEELKATREELAGQKKQLERQNQFIEKQNFEATFFRMLEQFERLIAGISGTNSEGREALLRIAPVNPPVGILAGGLIPGTGRPRTKRADNLDEIIEWWEKRYYPKNEPFLGGYFRVLYNILSFIDRSNLSDDEKRIYAGFVRATLSPQELALIYYNGISIHSKEKMKPLIERYALLKHIPKKMVDDEPLVFGAYAPEAFGTAP